MHNSVPPPDARFGLPEELQREPDLPRRSLLLPVFVTAAAVFAVIVWVPLP